MGMTVSQESRFCGNQARTACGGVLAPALAADSEPDRRRIWRHHHRTARAWSRCVASIAATSTEVSKATFIVAFQQ